MEKDYAVSIVRQFFKGVRESPYVAMATVQLIGQNGSPELRMENRFRCGERYLEN